MTDHLTRCAWLGDNPLMMAYHDEEWGVPVHDDRLHFEHLVLDGFQAGLSWAIILRKRDGFRKAFSGFDPEKLARYNRRSVERLLADPGIVRNRQKIEAAIANAKTFLRLQDEMGSFDEFIWQFVGGEPKQNRWRMLKQLPARTKESDAMSKALKQRGFRFVGSTICYAYMQAAGLVNDHIAKCFRHRELGGRA
ncbi:MAG: DNA-3-methyladenine glycosylase I [Gemmatimonadales bacterium]|nr:DNA-3-methyladenine glycosylase I [Gemmatimonadales bacterium]NIN12631.1 DNA-3-methyladenine glycosylase I [Gemmatimonadales bacterium]NIR02424.1 DNA-3-methyladenine glycosylase I [Gemmatimonadales bacterium]NIS66215.1 DNA-3-methyladenine glycosylase I [Gemmatimonadales bacterium]